MIRLLSICISACSAFITLFPVMLVLRVTILKNCSKLQWGLVYIYAIYLSGCFDMVGVPVLTSITVDPEVNWIPIIDIVNGPLGYIRNTVLNIILFVPLGFLVPILWREYDSLKKILLLGLGLSLLIEILQIFTFRLTDVDDLITNTVGTVIGYYFSTRLPETYRQRWRLSKGKSEPVIICMIVLVLSVTVQDIVSGMVWDCILASRVWQSIR